VARTPEQKARRRTPEQNARRRERYRNDPDYRESNNAKSREYHQRNREATRIYKREYYLRNRDKALASFLFNRHGMRPEDWTALWQAQDGRCYLCGDEIDRLGGRLVAVDHDHSHCGQRPSCQVCRRGLACMDCNIAIGHARDDPERLRRMADALQAAQSAVEHRKAEAREPLLLF
jgi:hypothetical protein